MPIDFSPEAKTIDYLSFFRDRIFDALCTLWFGWLGLEGGARPKSRAEVPNVRGLTVEEARHALSREGFKVEILRLEERPAPVMGTVVDQNPAPGRLRRRGHPVRLDVAHPRQPEAAH